MSLQTLDLIRDAIHRGAGADEARQQRLERSRAAWLDGLAAPLARTTELESLAADRGEHPEPARGRVGEPPRGDDGAEPRAAVITAERFGQKEPFAVGAVALRGRAGERACHTRVASRNGDHANVADRGNDEDDG